MTCREKFYIENAELEPERAVAKLRSSCPFEFGYIKDKGNCDGGCDKCWNQEIPEEDDSIEGKFTIATPIIKDSGNRRQFESGAVRDMQEGKGRCDLMPLEVVGTVMGSAIILDLKMFLNTENTTYLYSCLQQFSTEYDDGKTKASAHDISNQRYCSMFLEVAKHFEEGAKKYGENNWQKGIPVNCYIDSAVRHYLKWLRGDKDEPHDRAFVWNLMCCIWEVDYREKSDE